MAKQYWLMKSEPETYSYDDLEATGRTEWEGVRNYQARNFMQSMKIGDGVLFYHSNCKVPGVVAIAKVVKRAYPDFHAFDRKSPYYDAKSDPDNPRWFMVDVAPGRRLRRVVSLAELREYADGPLSELVLLRRGNRLSVIPVSAEEYRFIVALEKKKP